MDLAYITFLFLHIITPFVLIYFPFIFIFNIFVISYSTEGTGTGRDIRGRGERKRM